MRFDITDKQGSVEDVGEAKAVPVGNVMENMSHLDRSTSTMTGC